MPNNIIDKIQLSGVTYDIGGQGGSGVSVVEVTQAEYDALPSSAKTDTSKMYVITDAEAGDLTNYYTKTETNTLLGGKADTATTYTKTEVDTALGGKADTATTYTKTEVDNTITAATSTKQDTLVSGTNIKTINNISILGSGNIDVQGGSGGKAIEAGRGISITTGETADTVSFNLPISADSNNNITIGSTNLNNDKGKDHNFLFGSSNGVKTPANYDGKFNFLFGFNNYVGKLQGRYATQYNAVFGSSNCCYLNNSLICGNNNTTYNNSEFSSGQYNNSVSGSSTFGDSGNTLFSVGNGTADNARHNAFEIRQNGDIYLSSGGTDIKLQDHLGGGGTVSSAITSGDTNAVAGGAVYDKFDEVKQVTAQALNVLNEALSGKQDTLSAGTNITISGNVISASGGGKAIKAGRGITVTTGETADTISFSLPISDGTGMRSIIEGFETLASGDISHAEGFGTLASGEISHAEGYQTTGSGESSHAEGYYTIASGASSHAEGYSTIANGILSHAEGYSTIANNYVEHASGKFNVSTSASTTFGDSGNTLFSVGNGTANDARHNAFEIRQNGDIYFEYDGADTKLQDKFDEVEQVTARALIDLNDALSGKVNNSAITTTITSASTDSEIPSAKAVYDVLGDVETLLSQI